MDSKDISNIENGRINQIKSKQILKNIKNKYILKKIMYIIIVSNLLPDIIIHYPTRTPKF